MQSRLQSYLYPILTFVFPFLKDHNNCSLILLLLIVMFNILLWIYWTHNQEAPPKGSCMRGVLRNTIKSVKSFMWLHLIAYAFELVHDSFLLVLLFDLYSFTCKNITFIPLSIWLYVIFLQARSCWCTLEFVIWW